MALTIARSSASGCCPHTAAPCRTLKPAAPPALGGQLYYCAQCDEQRYSYHSCKNRHCPKCQNEQANDWLAAQQSLLLPVTHFLVTFTLPAELRAARSQQSEDDLQPTLSRFLRKPYYNWPRTHASSAPASVMVGVLHTWTRQLLYHPHVHYIVTGGGLTADGRWRSSRKDFLVPVKALSPIFRAKFREQLKRQNCFLKSSRASGAKTGWSIPNLSALAPKPSSISPLTSFASPSATTASVQLHRATSLSLTKSPPLTQLKHLHRHR